MSHRRCARTGATGRRRALRLSRLPLSFTAAFPARLVPRARRATACTSRTARSAHRAALIYLHRVAKAGGYRKYERMRRAAVMAMVVRNSKLPDALRIWVEHVADSFPDPLEERRPNGARVRLSS